MKIRQFLTTTALTGCFSLIALAVAGPVSAQTDVEADADDEVIYVTARKREETLQEAPVSVSVFTQDVLQAAKIDDISELSDFTPGFQLQSAFGRNGDRPVIRGTSNILTAEGKVGVFVDGVPFVGDFTSVDFSRLSRVEVIKGPQSAIFGRGTLSGAINFVTAAPSDEWGFDATVTLAEWEEFEASIGATGPIIPGKLYASIGAKVYSFNGDYTNTLTGEHLGEETKTLNVGLDWIAHEDVTISGRYIYSKDEDDHFPIALQNSTNNNCFFETRQYFCGEIDGVPTVALNTDNLLNPGLDREAHRFIATAAWDILGSGYSLDGRFGYTTLREQSGVDQTYDASEAFFIGPACAFFIPNCDGTVSAFNTDGEVDRDALSVEVVLNSPVEDALRWRLGGFYFKDETEDTGYGLKRTEFGPDSIGSSSEVENIAVFGGVEYDITERLTASAELRWARDEISTEQGPSYRAGDVFPELVFVPFPPQNPDAIVAGAGADRSADFTAVTPRFTLDYQHTDDLLFYAVASQGTSPGGFNPTDAPQSTFEEEELWNYELGMKSQWYDGDLTFNLAGFFIQYDNQTLTNTYTTAAGGLDSYRANIGETEIFGIEAEAIWNVDEYLTLAATYAYIDAEIVSGTDRDQAILFAGGTCNDLDATVPAGTVLGNGDTLAQDRSCANFGSLVGNEPPLVSDQQASFTLDYQRPLMETGYDWFFRSDVTYRSSFYAQVHNLAETGDVTEVRFAGGVKADNWTFRLWLENAFNDDSARGILRYIDLAAPPSPAGTTRAFGITPPDKRQFGATVSVSY